MPTTPPQSKSNPIKISQEEDIVFALRTQLSLQSELCTQYEVDLRARDELVEVLRRRVEHAEREGEKRRNVLKWWKKKVSELERVCRHLEDEVDQSRQDVIESEQEHHLASRLNSDAMKDEVERLRRQVQMLQQESADKEVKIVQLNKQRGQDKEDLHGLNIALDSKQQELELVCGLFLYIATPSDMLLL
jgi:chromosome segregation ATPase